MNHVLVLVQGAHTLCVCPREGKTCGRAYCQPGQMTMRGGYQRKADNYVKLVQTCTPINSCVCIGLLATAYPRHLHTLR